MSQEIEIEYKNLLTKSEFDRLLNALPFPKEATDQTNYYFETHQMTLKQSLSALRIRKRHDQYRLTLKEPHPKGLLETHDVLNEQEALMWINGKPSETPHIRKRLQAKNIDVNDLLYVGHLTTKRRTYLMDNDVLIVLDESMYNGTSDYELEVEAPEKELGKGVFKAILSKFHIIEKTTPNKIERFFATLP